MQRHLNFRPCLMVLFAIFSIGILTQCQLYYPEFRQGYELSDQAVHTLKPNLTKAQIQELLGTPSVNTVLNTQEWHYLHCLTSNPKQRDLQTCKKLSLYFQNDKLYAYSGDWIIKNLPKK